MAQKNMYGNQDERFSAVGGEIIRMILQIFENLFLFPKSNHGKSVSWH